MMKDLFLKVDGISNKEDALRWSINAAVQRNKVYKSDENYEQREQFRAGMEETVIRRGRRI
jgi:hypothetical protein